MPAGRPPELDSNGKPIAKCLVNVTIPVKLRDFLIEHNVNRSELFRTAALQYYNLEIYFRKYHYLYSYLYSYLYLNYYSKIWILIHIY